MLRRRRAVVAGALAGALLLGAGGAAWAAVAAGDEPAPVATPEPERTPTPEPTSTPTPTPPPEEEPPPAEPEEPAGPNPADYDIDDPNSITVVVNKQRPVAPIDWAPSDLVMPEGIYNANGQPLRAEAARALEQMYAEAASLGLPFHIASGYRDYNLQTSLFDNYASADGIEAAETYSARPGHSEHQLGLAVDIVECQGCALSEAFGQTEVGLWARENAHRYGFILRYDQGEQPVVGYVYEPWHFRYVGVEIATDMKNRGEKNLESYFGLPPAPGY